MSLDVSLVDRIYEAAVLPERWAQVCDLLSLEVEGYAASVITIGENQAYNWVTSPHNHEDMGRFSQNPLRFANIRPQRHMVLSHVGFMRDKDLMTDEEIADDPIYNEVMRPIGIGWTVGDIILEPSGHMIIFDILRQTERGPFRPDHVSILNSLRPDLARAALMSSRLAFREAESITRTLAALGLPSAVIGDGGDIIAMNRQMEDLAPRIRTGANNRPWLANVAANKLFQAILMQSIAGMTPSVQSIPIAAETDEPTLILHLLPVRREARDVFSKSAAIVVATQVGDVGAPDVKVLSGLFDLTASEARVARVLASGKSVEIIAKEFGVSHDTVRSHIKKIFQKTGVTRQSELVAMLSGLSFPHAIA